MIVQVKQEHIDAGGQNGLSCPVALAIRELLPDHGVYVGRVALTVHNGESKQKWRTMPVIVRRWIANYDSGNIVQPFEFEMDLG